MSAQGPPYDNNPAYYGTTTTPQLSQAPSQQWSYNPYTPQPHHSHDDPVSGTTLQINPDMPQLSMHYSHSSHNPHQSSSTHMSTAGFMVAGMPQPYTGSGIVIAGLPHGVSTPQHHTPISTPTNHSQSVNHQPWDLAPYAAFPSISEHPQLSQVRLPPRRFPFSTLFSLLLSLAPYCEPDQSREQQVLHLSSFHHCEAVPNECFSLCSVGIIARGFPQTLL